MPPKAATAMSSSSSAIKLRDFPTSRRSTCGRARPSAANGFRRRLECHHCGTFGPIPETCPNCGAEHSLVPCGPGIERIDEEVAALFPEARRALLSSDLSPSVSDLRETLHEIEDREVDIVIGTQLV